MQVKAFAVALTDDPTPPRDDKGGGHSLTRLKRSVYGRLNHRFVDLGWERLIGHHVAHRPLLGIRFGKRSSHINWVEVDLVFPERDRDAALIADVFRCPRHAVLKRQAHQLELVVDFALRYL